MPLSGPDARMDDHARIDVLLRDTTLRSDPHLLPSEGLGRSKRHRLALCNAHPRSLLGAICIVAVFGGCSTSTSADVPLASPSPTDLAAFPGASWSTIDTPAGLGWSSSGLGAARARLSKLPYTSV